MSGDGLAPEGAAGRSNAADAQQGLDQVRAEIRIVDEIERIRELRLRRDDHGVLDDEFLGAVADLDPDAADRLEEPLRFLRTVRGGIARHPAAASAVFRALVEEGRSVAATPEGGRRAADLAAHPMMAELRRVWEATTLNMLGDASGTEGAIPSGWVDFLLDAVIAGGAQDLTEHLSGFE